MSILEEEQEKAHILSRQINREARSISSLTVTLANLSASCMGKWLWLRHPR